MSKMPNSSAQVLMLVGTSCQYCSPMLASLSELVKGGVIDSLEVVNIEKKPEIAEILGVRTVPWLRIGWFELEGLRSKSELTRWVNNTSSENGISEYYAEILAQGRVKQCLGLLKQHPETMASIISLMSDPNEKINIKLGIGVIFEEMASSSEFEKFIPALACYLGNEDARLRLDACYYSTLTQNPKTIALIEPLVNDENEEVREEAKDSIESLSEYDRDNI